MNSLILLRDIRTQKQTKGQLFVLNENADEMFSCFTLELPWRNNAQEISCIPEDRYKVKKRWSKKYGWHLHILGVPGRDLILIHEANFVRQLLGCIAVGDKRVDIDGDGLKDVTNSVKTKGKLLELLPDETEIHIRDI